MFSPPLRRSSPGPGLCTSSSVFQPTRHDLEHPSNDARISPRPCLKRQATAPLPSHSTVLTKKKRETSLSTKFNDVPLWSDEVHAAFLEALQKHPPSSMWRLDETSKDAPDDGQAEYCRIIQDYILSKTGLPRTVEQISEQINLVLSSPLASPLIRTPAEDKAIPLATGEEIGFTFPDARSDNALGLNAQSRFCRSRQLGPATMRSIESTSMSRRRKACNRPILNLHVDLPPFGLGISPTAESGSTTGLTPQTASFLQFGQPSDSQVLSNPKTPLEQCHKAPLSPPEIPRVINARRCAVGRWIPTPTEGVLPSLNYVSAVSSPLSATSSDCSSESSSSDSAGSSTTERMQSRPELMRKQLSWLTVPKQTSQAHDSPLTAFRTEAARTPPVNCRIVSDS